MNSELIASLLSRTIAYHPVFRDVAGSTVGAVFLSQAYYWSTGQRIPSERAGWFYKTGKQWQEETRLSRSEQIRARRDLKKAGLLEEKRRGRPGRLFYRLNIKRLFELISLLTKSCSGGSSSGEGNGSKGAASAGDPSGQVQAGHLQTEGNQPVQGQSVLAKGVQARAEIPLYSASLQDSALSDYEAKNPFKNSSMQDSAVLANGAYCLNYPHNDSSKKASEINSMQNAAFLNSWDQHLNTGPFTASQENAFNNSSLQDSGVRDQVSALTMQDSAIKAQNPDIKSAESCDLYTEITTENTSQITAAAVPAVGYEAHDYHEAVLTPAAAYSTQPSEEVIQGGSIQSGQQAWSGSNPGQSSDRQANEHPIDDQSDQNIPHDHGQQNHQSQQSTPNHQGPFQPQAEITPQDRVHQQTQGTSLARFPCRRAGNRIPSV
ncbi:helix-turn-helix domain-containing protein [Oceanospirillum sediminis]|uniref:Helix-turn-helix transcriptional regulator n=1 Tax=Oceanospirillum sediminis TaxID=2760088 RepID=A0A839ILN9_9GAMM|nr:helix-turn-helix domain-containing protein [Oceanospirillum sediminis]MBB1485801.1 helix-turn-helix transcriptional regulator [Oceanospirillum sediminis]